MSETKPGVKTSEFWLTLVASIVGAVMGAELFPEDSTVGKVVTIAAVILPTLGYSVSRGAAKKAGAA